MKAKYSQPSSSFLLTLNQPSNFDKVKQYLLSLRNLRYAIAGKEKAPSTGHEHMHIFVQFKRSCRLTLKSLYGCHVDKCNGTPQQNRDYVEKGEIIWDYGEMRSKGWLTIEQVKKLKSQERIKLPIQYYRIVKDIDIEESKKMFVDDIRKNIKVYYISGHSGAGKTNFAFRLIGKDSFNLVKYENGFWMGVTSTCKIALYDDWRDDHMAPSEFINFIDYNKHIMNVKCGCAINNYNIIIITTIMRMEDIYEKKKAESRFQWERRMHEILIGPYTNSEREKKINQLADHIETVMKMIIFKRLKDKNIYK